MVNLDLPIYVDSLCNKLTKPTLGGGGIRTNAYVIKVGPLSWELNIDIQFMTLGSNQLLHIVSHKIY